jgi:hypothetical protein
MKKFFLTDSFTRSSIRSAAAVSLLLMAGLLFASTLLAGKSAEPGPEADGVYSCGKTPKGKYVDLGKLEIKGRTYATYSKDDPKETRRFDSFTADASGRLVWSVGFNFLSWSAHMAGGTSTYSVDAKGKPSILINYSDDHNPTFMTCTKDQ